MNTDDVNAEDPPVPSLKRLGISSALSFLVMRLRTIKTFSEKDFMNEARNAYEKLQERPPFELNDRPETLLQVIRIVTEFVKPVQADLLRVINDSDGSTCIVFVQSKSPIDPFNPGPIGLSQATGLSQAPDQSQALQAQKIDPVMKQWCQFSTNELGYVKKVIDKIVNESSGKCAMSALLNERPPKISALDAERVLDTMFSAKWLEKNSHGVVVLSARGKADLRQYLDDISDENTLDCSICKNTVVYGEECPECRFRLHFVCAQGYFGANATRRCRNCNSEWRPSNN